MTEEVMAVMDRKNIRAMVNVTGGYEKALEEVINKYDLAFPERFYTFTEPCYEGWKEHKYPELQAQAIEQAHRQGARGLKILKTLGLYLRENITSGQLVRVDDPRFDPMWDVVGCMWPIQHAGSDSRIRPGPVFYTYRSVQRAL